MSLKDRLVTTYAKSLFQNIVNSDSIKKEKLFEPSEMTSSEQATFTPDVFIIGEELILVRSILISSKEIDSFFKNPTYPEQQKLEIIFNIFPGLTIITKAFLRVLTERNHLSLIPEISETYNKILLKFKNITSVKLITASPLDENLGSLLLKALRKITKSEEIVLTLTYNPKLLGGLILEYNSVAIDASILKEFSLFFSDI
jgi:F-type H+-transporting ATPase subunit delta